MRANATTSDQRSAAFNNIFGNAPPPGRTPGVQSRSGHLPGQRPQRPSLPPGYNNFSYVNSLNHPPQQLRPPPLTNQHYYPDSQYLAHHYQQRPLPQQRPPQLPFNGSDGYRNPPPIRVHDHPSAPSSYTAPQYDSNQNQFPQRSYPPPAYSSRSISSGDPPTAPALNSDSYRTRSLQSAPPPNRNISATSSLSQTPQERSHSFSSASDSRSDSMSRAPPKRQFSTATTTSNLSGISEVDRTYSISSIASTNTATVQSRQKRPAVTYPALLSLVSEAFRNRLFLSDKQKDGLTYKAAFSGSEAVDMIMHLIKTTDRNLALLLGRSLDAQKFFHDVTYEHRLRDRANEIYQFRERLNSPSFENPSDLADLISSPSPRVSGDMDDFPNGVFTLLTECYSPTCTRDRLCYSIACPRRLEQQARLNLKPTGLKRADSRASLKEDEGEQKLWIHSVPKEIAELTSDKEKKRQEVICEVSYTERDFVKDLEYLRDFWIKPLRIQSTISDSYRDKFIKTVFSNILEVHVVNCRLAEALTRRQQREPVVSTIGDIFLEYVPRFEPFIKYGANQLWGKYEFEKEKSSNPFFAKFAEETERLKESRKLELNGYLTKPTTRLARYPLLLEAVLKYTDEDNSDHEDIPKAIELIRQFLARVNEESGKSENLFNLMQLEERLSFKQGENVDLKLSDPNRQMLHKGMLKKRESSSDTRGDTVQVFLFDHALLIVKVKVVSKREQYKVTRRPIPLELLVVSTAEEPRGSLTKRPSSSLLPGTSKNGKLETTKADTGKSGGYSLVFTHLGRRGYTITLYAGTYVNRRKWIENISSQQRLLIEGSRVFVSVVTCEKYFMGGNRVNCLVPFDGGRKLAYGTDTGIYVSDRKPHSTTKSTPVRTLTLSNVAQMDILEEYGLILVLSDKSLFSFPLEALDPNDQTLANKRPRKIAGHLNFFKVGVCLGRFLVCVVKSSVLSSTIKVFEPVDHVSKGKKQPAFRKLLQGGTEMLKVFKEFYIPTESSSIHFLKTKLCVGCAKGFEVVSLENLETQSLLDPADTSLDFVQRRETVRPIAIYRMNGEFLVCYDEFAFFVNKNGWRARSDWIIHWEGMPSSFALNYPYILAFEPSFIEIHHLESGALSQVIPGNNITLLSDGRGKLGEGGEILYGCENSEGENQVHALMRHI